MAQRFLVDRRLAASYLAIGLMACGAAPPGPVVPVDAPVVSATQARQWVQLSTPAGHRLLRFHWQLQDERGAAGGRGTARIASSDSVRLDVVGPLGAGRGAAVVIADSARWTDPPDVIQRLVPSYPLMWAMFGVMREPPRDAEVRGLADSAAVRWQWVLGPDTVRYEWRRAPAILLAEARHAGQQVGQVTTAFEARQAPTSSRLMAPSVPVKISITYSESRTTDSFPPDLWRPPEP